MSFTDGFRTYLTAQSPITAIVGSTKPRVYGGNKIPEGKDLPCIVYFRAGAEHFQYMAAASGRAIATLQVDSWDTTYVGALALSEAVRGELDGYQGAMGDDNCRMCHLQGDVDDFVPSDHGDDIGRYVVSQTYLIGYSESVPTF